MKRLYYFLSTTLCLSALLIPVAVFAEDGDDIPATRPAPATNMPKPAIPPGPGSLGQKIRADIQEKTTNIRLNQDVRNKVLENTTSTGAIRRDMLPPMVKELKDMKDMKDIRSSMGSSTIINKINQIREEQRQKVRKDVFELEKRHVMEQLQHSLDNLKQVRNRISARITKAEQSGRTMTEAKKLLTTADTKISAAQIAISGLLNVSATSTDPAATTTVDLTKPREVAANAVKLIKDAQRSLNDVVVAIAHAMGLRLEDGDKHASTTPRTATTTRIVE